jgi:hypothetical protein
MLVDHHLDDLWTGQRKCSDNERQGAGEQDAFPVGSKELDQPPDEPRVDPMLNAVFFYNRVVRAHLYSSSALINIGGAYAR